MKQLDIFVSVGGTANERQEKFVLAVEERLRSEGLSPHTVGRNTFSAGAPLKTVTELIDKCSGSVVIALERSHFETGLEKRGGPKESTLNNVKLPTPWNQIEAALSYARGLPLLVIVESGVRNEGLLEHGYDWYVQTVETDASALTSSEFNGVLASWKQMIIDKPKQSVLKKGVEEFTVAELLGSLKPLQLWSFVATIGALIAGAFALGGQILGGK